MTLLHGSTFVVKSGVLTPEENGGKILASDRILVALLQVGNLRCLLARSKSKVITAYFFEKKQKVLHWFTKPIYLYEVSPKGFRARAGTSALKIEDESGKKESREFVTDQSVKIESAVKISNAISTMKMRGVIVKYGCQGKNGKLICEGTL